MKRILFWVLAALSVVACGDKEYKEQLAKVDPAVDISIHRFDRDILSTDSTEAADLLGEYPAFSDIYFTQVLGFTPDVTPQSRLHILQSDSNFANLAQEVYDVHPNLGKWKSQFSQAFENYATLFGIPTSQIPDLYTFIAGFTYQSFVFQDGPKEGVGLGLEMFLGEDFPYKQVDPSNPIFSSYITRAYTPEHMVKKAVEVLVEDKLPPPSGNDFLSLMIWGGKKLYVMDEILDFLPDSIIHEYTGDQMTWARENEEEMWDFFYDKDLFYSTNFNEFNKLVSPAPTSPGMPPESPGRTGNYMGQQIVESYMARNTDISIRELLLNDDAQKILDASRYRPG